MHQNETKRHFELRDLEAQMRRAHKEASKVVSRGQVARMQWASMVLAAAIVAIVGAFLLLLVTS
jgi:hypothetical protein